MEKRAVFAALAYFNQLRTLFDHALDALIDMCRVIRKIDLADVHLYKLIACVAHQAAIGFVGLDYAAMGVDHTKAVLRVSQKFAKESVLCFLL